MGICGFSQHYFCVFLLRIYVFVSYESLYVGGGKEYICVFFISGLLYCEQILFPVQGYLQFVGQHYIWFCFGILISYYKNCSSKIWNFLKQSKNIFGAFGIGFIILALLKQNLICLNIATFICVITCYLIIPDKENAVCLLFSKNSFGIYLIHSPLIYITFKFFSEYSPFFVIGLNFILWGGISLCISVFLKRTRYKWVIGE